MLHHNCTDSIDTKDQENYNELFTTENMQHTPIKIATRDINTNVECVLDTTYIRNEVAHDMQTLANSLSINP